MFVGVDGGGTKTAFVLLSDSGQVVHQNVTSTCSYLSVGLERSRQLLTEGVKALLAEAGVSSSAVSYAFFGLPAYGEDSDLIPELNSLPSDIFPLGNFTCDNDMVNAWAGSLACEDGINIVAGTGSICYGRNQGATARCGGWGELFSDEGSAYWIAIQGLNVFSRMSDGRLEKGLLYELFREHFKLSSDLDLTTIILDRWGGDRSKVAALCKEVSRAAKLGDVQAGNVLKRAASELALIVDATGRSLAFETGEKVLVSYSGGVFAIGNAILEPFERMLESFDSNYCLCKPLLSPSIGAALYAATLAGKTFGEQMINQLVLQEDPN